MSKEQNNLSERLRKLQQMVDQHLPPSIRNDAELIEYAIQDRDEKAPALTEMQILAAEVTLWTVEMFEAIEEGEI